MKHQSMTLEEFRALTNKTKGTKPAIPKEGLLLGAPSVPAANPAVKDVPPQLVGRAADCVLDLPLPPAILQPNQLRRAGHWAQRSKATAKARDDAALCAKCFYSGPVLAQATMHATFFLHRKQDDDNLIGWLKAYRDGLQGAVYASDEHVTMLPPAVIIDRKSATRVVLRIYNDQPLAALGTGGFSP